MNGRPESVRIGASFPSSNPVFRLVSVSRAGREDRHRQRLVLERRADGLAALNRTVTLVDSTNGAHYKLQLLGS